MAKIAIDAGHGRYTSGKRCLKKLDPNETREWVLNDRVADALGSYLKQAGHTIKRMDDTDGSTDVSLESRVKKANEWEADFYISVHHNAGIAGGSGGGTEVYVCSGCQSKSKKAQAAIYKHAVKRGNLKGNRSDGTKTANFYVIVHTKMPACLIECGFMDSKTDIKKILNKSWSKKIALGIAEGICEVFGGKVDRDKEPEKKPKKKPEKPATEKEKYYKKYKGGSSSIVDALKAISVNNSFNNRKKIAKANGIKNYSGTGAQNVELLSLLRRGKLKRP